MDKLKISVVNYTNSLPFIYGLEHSDFAEKFEIHKDIPSVCADKLIQNQVDIGLVPVAILPQLEKAIILGDYCIGANGEVASVLLLSDVPLEAIESIFLDFHSRTSVQLVQVLAKHYWKIQPNWIPAEEGFIAKIQGNKAAVVIGDRSFGLKEKYNYCYDLAAEWKKFCDLPFVFAVWVANKELAKEQLSDFNAAIAMGMMHIDKVIKLLPKHNFDPEHYLKKNISYRLDDAKKKGLEKFLGLMEGSEGQKKQLFASTLHHD